MKNFNELSSGIQNLIKLGISIGAVIGLGWTAHAMFSSKADIQLLELKADKEEVQVLEQKLAGSLQRQQALGIDSEIRQRQEWIRYINNLIRQNKATPADHQAKERIEHEIKFLEAEKARLYR